MFLKKISMILALSTMAAQANAEIFKCGFTEPFIHFTYDTSTQTLVEQDNVAEKSKTNKDISFQIKYAGTFLLKNKAGKIVAELMLNNKGSDGMSDAIYPYSVKYIGMDDSTGVNGLWGGCTSSLKPMVKEAE